MSRIPGTITMAADAVERELYAGLDFAGTVRRQAPDKGWAAFDMHGSALGVFADEDLAGRAVLHAFAELRNRGAGE